MTTPDIPLLREGLSAAHDVLSRCASPDGWLASASDFEHYASLWTRDAAFTGLALGATTRAPYADATRATVLGLVRRQAELGQMPVVYFRRDEVWDWGEAGATDGTAMFILLAAQHLRTTSAEPEHDRIVAAMEKAFLWLRHQDANNFGLIDSPQAADWMDSTLNRSGKILHNNVLFYAAARALSAVHGSRGDEHIAIARDIKRRGNILFWPERADDFHQLLAHVPYPAGSPRFSHEASLSAYTEAIREDRAHYLAHVEYGRFVDRSDVLANVLAVTLGFADPPRARTIVRHLLDSDAVVPYPARSWTVPFTPHDDSWGVHKRDAERYQAERWRNPPHRYHNAGVWPFIGGWLVAAACATSELDAARRLLRRLLAANRLSDAPGVAWGFHEWIDSATGAPAGGAMQAWSAAGLVLADDALRRAAASEAGGDLLDLGAGDTDRLGRG